jgi:hypothetical protein
MDRKSQATIRNLYHVPEDKQAEIIDGKLIIMPLASWPVAYATGEIFSRLH